MAISIHALREEGDWLNGGYWDNEEVFLSTPSARRATMILPMTESRLWLFLSTPSARRATCLRRGICLPRPISIHALREEGDIPKCGTLGGERISIHALREEGDF